MTKREDLRLQGDTGSKTGADQSEKGNKKRAHRDTHQDLTNARNHCIFSSDGVFGNHTQWVVLRVELAAGVIVFVALNAGWFLTRRLNAGRPARS